MTKKKLKPIDPLTCVQCGDKLKDYRKEGFCINAECPNFGLLQVGIEFIADGWEWGENDK